MKATFENIKKIYQSQDDCMGDLLYNIPADGMSIGDAFELAIKCSRWADGDRYFRVLGTDDIKEVNEEFKEFYY